MLQVFCDFDGTITQEDATDALLEQFAKPQWRDWEALWQAGEISARECLSRQVSLLRVHPKALAEFIRALPIDRAFATLATECTQRGIPLTIVSDGLDCIVKGVLHHHGLSQLRYFANQVVWEARDRMSLSFPYAERHCDNGACKCRLTRRSTGPSAVSVYIGDGRSDFCVVQQMDRVYAKTALADWCRCQSIPYEPFETLEQVVSHLCPERVLSR